MTILDSPVSAFLFGFFVIGPVMEILAIILFIGIKAIWGKS